MSGRFHLPTSVTDLAVMRYFDKIIKLIEKHFNRNKKKTKNQNQPRLFFAKKQPRVFANVLTGQGVYKRPRFFCKNRRTFANSLISSDV